MGVQCGTAEWRKQGISTGVALRTTRPLRTRYLSFHRCGFGVSSTNRQLFANRRWPCDRSPVSSVLESSRGVGARLMVIPLTYAVCGVRVWGGYQHCHNPPPHTNPIPPSKASAHTIATTHKVQGLFTATPTAKAIYKQHGTVQATSYALKPRA